MDGDVVILTKNRKLLRTAQSIDFVFDLLTFSTCQHLRQPAVNPFCGQLNKAHTRKTHKPT